MERIIDQIEKFLRGQMSQEEEWLFRASLATNAHFHSLSFLVVYILRMQKTGKD